jgi:hypothetical protein
MIEPADLAVTCLKRWPGFRRARRSLVIVHNGRNGAGAGGLAEGGIVVTNHHGCAGAPASH